MLLLGFLIVLLVLSLGKLFISIDRFSSATKIERNTATRGDQFDDLTFFDSRHLLTNDGK